MTYEQILNCFKVVRRSRDSAQCQCPAHNDKQASLTVTKGRSGVLVHCHAGCQLEEILTAAGLTKSDLFYDDRLKTSSWQSYVQAREKRKIEAVYNYVSCDGDYAFTKVRLEGKKIIYGKLVNERFTYGLNGKSRKSYKAVYGDLNAVKMAIKEQQPIFIVEGEKDVNTLARRGYKATFTYGGVNDWQADFAEIVKGGKVYTLADNDNPGRRVADQILADIKSVTAFAKIIIPTPDIPKGDITDFFEAGHTDEEFERLLEDVTEKSEQIDLLQFHHVSNGKATSVYHYKVFEYIKEHYHIFVCGGTPYVYCNGVYKPDSTGARLKSIIRSLILSEFIRSTTINQIYNLFLQDITLEVSFEELNNYPSYWINFQNGMYDVKQKRLLPHNPVYRAINQVPHKYKGTGHAGKKIEAFLSFVCDNEDDREMLLEFVGYSLTKDVSQQKFLVLNGSGGTGKSTVIRLIESLVGSCNISNISLTDLQQRFASFGLLGKLLNSCADLEISALEDTSILKKVLGEDTLRGEQKGRDAISFKSYAKLIFSTNELPLVRSEKTNGFYRRLLVLTMNKVPLQKNPCLFEELSSEIDYFLDLSVKALERMYQRGMITVSAGSVRAVAQLRADSDTVEAFLMEKCCKEASGKEDRGRLYNAYDSYCRDSDRQALTKNNFYKSLRAKGFTEFKSAGIRFFKGIFLEESSPDSAPETALDGFKNVTEDVEGMLPFD